MYKFHKQRYAISLFQDAAQKDSRILLHVHTGLVAAVREGQPGGRPDPHVLPARRADREAR